MVGTGRFELPTPRTPSECSTRLSHVPTSERTRPQRGPDRGPWLVYTGNRLGCISMPLLPVGSPARTATAGMRGRDLRGCRGPDTEYRPEDPVIAGRKLALDSRSRRAASGPRCGSRRFAAGNEAGARNGLWRALGGRLRMSVKRFIVGVPANRSRVEQYPERSFGDHLGGRERTRRRSRS